MAIGLLVELIPGFLAALVTLFFGGYVLYHGPRRRTHQVLALVLFFTALTFLTIAVGVVQYPGFEAWRWGEVYRDFLLGVPLFFLLFALVTSPRAREDSPWLHPTPWLLVVVAFAVVRIVDRQFLGNALSGSDPAYGGGILSHVSWVSSLALGLVPLVFVRRALRAPPAVRDTTLILATGLAAWHLYNSSRNAVFLVFYGPAAPTTVGAAVDLLLYAAATLLALATPAWVARAALQVRPPSPTLRRACVFLLATVFAGALDQILYILRWNQGVPIPLDASLRFGLWATWMLLSAAILAYGILRGDVIGLARKARRTIRTSTVAGAFVVVFFVASEMAKQFFERENPVVGIVAAGLLALALAPLQRIADRLANTTLPPKTHEPLAVREAAYCDAVRIALRDRRLTPSEEIDLMYLAKELGLPAERAAELRAEVGSEDAPPRDASPRKGRGSTDAVGASTSPS